MPPRVDVVATKGRGKKSYGMTPFFLSNICRAKSREEAEAEQTASVAPKGRTISAQDMWGSCCMGAGGGTPRSAQLMVPAQEHQLAFKRLLLQHWWYSPPSTPRLQNSLRMFYVPQAVFILSCSFTTYIFPPRLISLSL